MWKLCLSISLKLFWKPVTPEHKIYFSVHIVSGSCISTVTWTPYCCFISWYIILSCKAYIYSSTKPVTLHIETKTNWRVGVKSSRYPVKERKESENTTILGKCNAFILKGFISGDKKKTKKNPYEISLNNFL